MILNNAIAFIMCTCVAWTWHIGLFQKVKPIDEIRVDIPSRSCGTITCLILFWNNLFWILIYSRTLCQSSEVEDKYHFLCNCQCYIDKRHVLFTHASEQYSKFLILDGIDKFVFLLNNMEYDVSIFLDKAYSRRCTTFFVKQSQYVLIYYISCSSMSHDC